MNEQITKELTPVQEKAIALRKGMQVGDLYVRAYSCIFDNRVNLYVAEMQDTASHVSLTPKELEELISLAQFFEAAVKAEVYTNEAKYSFEDVKEITTK